MTKSPALNYCLHSVMEFEWKIRKTPGRCLCLIGLMASGTLKKNQKMRLYNTFPASQVGNNSPVNARLCNGTLSEAEWTDRFLAFWNKKSPYMNYSHISFYSCFCRFSWCITNRRIGKKKRILLTRDCVHLSLRYSHYCRMEIRAGDKSRRVMFFDNLPSKT